MLAGSPSEVVDGVEAVRAVAEDCALVKPRRVMAGKATVVKSMMTIPSNSKAASRHY